MADKATITKSVESIVDDPADLLEPAFEQRYTEEEYRDHLHEGRVRANIEGFLKSIPKRYPALVSRRVRDGGMWGTFSELISIANTEQVCFVVYNGQSFSFTSTGFSISTGPALPPVGIPKNPRIYLWLTGEDLGCGHYSLLIPTEPKRTEAITESIAEEKEKRDKISVTLKEPQAIHEKAILDLSQKTAELDALKEMIGKSQGKPAPELEQRQNITIEEIPRIKEFIKKTDAEILHLDTMLKEVNAVISKMENFLSDLITTPDGICHKIFITPNGDCLFDAAIQGLKVLRTACLFPPPSTPEEIVAIRERTAKGLLSPDLTAKDPKAAIDTILTLFSNLIFSVSASSSDDAGFTLPKSVLIEEATGKFIGQTLVLPGLRQRLSIAIHASNRLRLAARNGHPKTVLRLIDLGVDIDAQESYRNIQSENSFNTALHEALIALNTLKRISPSDPKIAKLRIVIKLLRDHGARSNIANKDGLTAEALAKIAAEVLPPMVIPQPMPIPPSVSVSSPPPTVSPTSLTMVATKERTSPPPSPTITTHEPLVTPPEVTSPPKVAASASKPISEIPTAELEAQQKILISTLALEHIPRRGEVERNLERIEQELTRRRSTHNPMAVQPPFLTQFGQHQDDPELLQAMRLSLSLNTGSAPPPHLEEKKEGKKRDQPK